MQAGAETDTIASPEEVLRFRLEEQGPKGWYAGGDALDQEIRDKYMDTWVAAKRGDLGSWTNSPQGTLALLIVLDQFPRNMFRGSGDSFATDAMARAVAKKAIDMGWDMRIDEPARQFFYMPLMHSECLVDQDRCVRLVLTRMPEGCDMTLPHAQAHREVIREFGRFPYRNEAMGRTHRPEETAYIEAGGYGHTIRSLKGEGKAA